MTVVLGGEMTVTVLPQAHGVTEIVTVIVMNVTAHLQVLGVDVMTGGVMIVDVTTDGVTIVAVKIVVVKTDGVTTVGATIVDVKNVGATIVKGRWHGEDATEMSVTVHQGTRGVATVIAGIGIVMIVTVETVMEIVLEEIVMIVIALAGGVSALMTVIVTVIRGGVEGTSQAVTSGDEIHRLRVLKVGKTLVFNEI